MTTQSFVETAKYLSSSSFDPPSYLRPTGGPYETTYTASFQGIRPHTTPYSMRPITLSRSYEFPSKILQGSSSGLEHLPYTAVNQRAIHKYSPQQWRSSNLLNVSSGEKERATAERLRDECSRLRTETSLRTHRTQMDVNKKLDNRIHDISYWKAELEKQHNETVAEIKALQAFIGRLEKALAATEKPLNIAQQCLGFRERRVKIDLVHDSVENHLSKEVEMIENVQALLKKTMDQAHEQLWLLRNAKTQLEKDLGDKYGALGIDGKCSTLNNFSKEIHFAPHSVTIQQHSFTPDEWEAYSSENIAKAERERKASVALRSEINGILMQTYVDLKNIYETVNNEFSKRIQDTDAAKKSLEKELARVMDEISSMENNIRDLRMAIGEKEAPLKVAHTRLDKRSIRPNVELCRDPVQYRLVGEVGEINTSIDRLRMRLAEAEGSMQALVRNKENLEDDIEVKTNSLFIDRDQCMVIRQQVRHISH
ncbi:tektin-1-like [Actinia tenebrosa]|uniref:Tektin n=1 Tax=Actinia tenebrosa TaxID=6105 RepID=A0A6P8IIY5_ACTTE|nr:tektin-1-like [Actinia tenebrosa]